MNKFAAALVLSMGILFPVSAQDEKKPITFQQLVVQNTAQIIEVKNQLEKGTIQLRESNARDEKLAGAIEQLAKRQEKLANDVKALDLKKPSPETFAKANKVLSQAESIVAESKTISKLSKTVAPAQLATFFENPRTRGKRGKTVDGFVALFARTSNGKLPLAGRAIEIYSSYEEIGKRRLIKKAITDENGRASYPITLPTKNQIRAMNGAGKKFFVHFVFKGTELLEAREQAPLRVGT